MPIVHACIQARRTEGLASTAGPGLVGGLVGGFSCDGGPGLRGGGASVDAEDPDGGTGIKSWNGGVTTLPRDG